MSAKNAMLVTGSNMASVDNEAYKIQVAFHNKGIPCDIYFFNKSNPRATRIPRYNLGIWWTPLIPMFMSHQKRWMIKQKCDLAVSYFVIEGLVKRLQSFKQWLSWQYIITPSNFVKRNIEEMGIPVKEVIPHQAHPNLPIDNGYGRYWRSRFPSDKKILLYNGSQINRKGLPKLREAINILSKTRNDFIMVLHTDKLNIPFHTPIRELEGVNTVIETDFPNIPIAQAYAKMFYSDYIIHPALVEGFGLPVLEALQMGKPLVCINTYGVNEIATPENSFMVRNVKPSILEWKGYIDFKICDYEPIELANQINIALNASQNTINDKIAKGYETVKRFTNTYDRFTSFI